MSSSSPPASSPAPYHRLKRAPVTPPLERPSWYPVNDERNSEANHIQALEEARLFHERVRENALAVLRLNEAEAQLAALEIEEARIAALEEANAEAARKTQELNNRTAAIRARTQAQAEAQAQAQAQALQAQQAARAPPPPQVRPLPTPIVAAQPVPTTTGQPPRVTQGSFISQPTTQAPPPSTQPVLAPQQTQTAPPTTQPRVAPQSYQAPPQAQAQNTQVAQPPSQSLSNSHLQRSEAPIIEYKEKEDNSVVNKDNARLKKIHQELKALRKALQDKFAEDPQLKKKAGEMRRLIRMSVGQLTGGEANQSKNKRQVGTFLLPLSSFTNPNRSIPSLMCCKKLSPTESCQTPWLNPAGSLWMRRASRWRVP